MSDTRHDPVRGSGAEAADGPLGRLVVVFDNEIARALAGIAATTGWEVAAATAAADVPEDLAAVQAVVVCNHDGDGAGEVLRRAVRAGVGYVAMMASRHRSAALLGTLREEGLEEEALRRLHVPAGLAIGGRTPGEIALSVMAEVVADRHGRPGGPMREH